MVLPIALLTISAILIIKGFTGASLSDIVNGDFQSNTVDDVDTGIDPTDDTFSSNSDNDVSVSGNLPASTLRTRPVTIDGHSVAGWVGEIVLWARKHGWTGQVTSGIRSDSEQATACQHVCGNSQGCPGTCAKPGTSNHRGKIFPLGAVDVTNPSQFASVLKKYPGGAPIKNDLPNDTGHFSRTGH